MLSGNKPLQLLAAARSHLLKAIDNLTQCVGDDETRGDVLYILGKIVQATDTLATVDRAVVNRMMLQIIHEYDLQITPKNDA